MYLTDNLAQKIRIAITSGKGGTGKTTISTGLFYYLTNSLNIPVQLVDCDVEEPNCHLFIPSRQLESKPVTINIPVIDKNACSFCGKCKAVCAFHAIVLLPSTNFIEIIPDMCHACGACSYICPENAITETTKEIGEIRSYRYRLDHDFMEGRMHVGIGLQTRVIHETIRHSGPAEIILYDAPPGTSCPVVTTISKADYVIMVTEPTPYGLHDLKLMTETVRQMDKPHGVVINKAGLQYPDIYQYIRQNELTLLAEIPFDKKYAKAYSEGKILPEADASLLKWFKQLYAAVRKHCTYS